MRTLECVRVEQAIGQPQDRGVVVVEFVGRSGLRGGQTCVGESDRFADEVVLVDLVDGFVAVPDAEDAQLPPGGWQ